MTATIAAIATGPAPGGVGVIRISGPLALEAARGVAPELPAAVEPRRAYLGRFCDRAGEMLDEGLVLWFAGPRSYTGEDVAELHAHGSPRLLSLLLGELLKDGRLRLAEPGEFSRRAYLNGRLDLSRAEAVGALIAAQSEAAVRASAAQLRGVFGERVQEVRRPLLELRADLEGALNFPDEADGADDGFAERVEAMRQMVEGLSRSATAGRWLRRSARVPVYGPVNAGKSTLFNRLIGEDRALVHAAPGTTRDVLEATVELEGVSVTFQDTAGLRAAESEVEGLGVARARSALAAADLGILVLEPTSDASEERRWRAEASPEVLVVRGKGDLELPNVDPSMHVDPRWPGGALRVSGLTGLGVEALRAAIRERLTGGISEGALAASERQAAALGDAECALQRAALASKASTLEVVSGELGIALEALGQITGETASDEVLDEVFRRFCIGK